MCQSLYKFEAHTKPPVKRVRETNERRMPGSEKAELSEN